jgi:hypothetical protein
MNAPETHESSSTMPHPRLTRTRFLGLAVMALLVTSGCDSEAPASPDTRSGSTVKRDLPDDAALKATLDEVLDYTYDRRLNPTQHAAWQIMHGLLAYPGNFKIEVNGEMINALDWILGGGNLNGWTMHPTSHGLEAVLEPGTKSGQGHEDQWLAILAQCDLPAETPLKIGTRTFQIGDLVKQAKWDLRNNMEASWTVIGLNAYVALDETWEAADGQQWSLEKVVDMEASQEIDSSACGGTHRLIGLSMALNRYVAEVGPDEPRTGAWKKAEDLIDDAIKKAKMHQQPDGSFSTTYFVRPASSPDLALRVNTTGHMLEFLVLALPEEQFHEDWVTRAVVQLCDCFNKTRTMDLDCGSLYHAAHALQLYRLRRFGQRENLASDSLAPQQDVGQESEGSAESDAVQDTEPPAEPDAGQDTETSPEPDAGQDTPPAVVKD